MKDEALQMCLEYIETDAHERRYVRHAIKQALAEPVQDTEAHYKGVVEGVQKLFDDKRAQPAPVQEPVAWMREGWGPDCGPYIEFYRDDEMGWRDRKEWTSLYTTPPAVQRQWVGLTAGERDSLFTKHYQWDDYGKAIEAKLKEKNT